MLSRMLAVLTARNKEFLRDRSSLTWNLVFPVILIVGFYVLLGQAQPMFKVGVISEQDAYVNRPQLMALDHIQFVPYAELADALDRARRHQIDLVIDLDQRLYWVNEESRQGYMVERLLASSDADFQRRRISGEPIRYLDWVLPGILGMNIMFASLFGVGHALVRYRKNGMLKRLQATPLSALEFVSAQILSRLITVLGLSCVLFFASHWLFGTLMLGSVWALLLTFVLGALAMIALGLVVASRTRSEELTSGLMNMAAWPMMGLSEVWFSLQGAPLSLQRFSDWLPLTHLVQASRAIATEGAGLAAISHHLLTLAGMTLVLLLIAAALFRWDSDRR